MGHTIKTISYFIVTAVAFFAIVVLSMTLTVGTDTADRLQSAVRNELYLNSDASYALNEAHDIYTNNGETLPKKTYYKRALVLADQSKFEQAVRKDMGIDGLQFKYYVRQNNALVSLTTLGSNDEISMVKVYGTSKGKPYETNIFMNINSDDVGTNESNYKFNAYGFTYTKAPANLNNYLSSFTKSSDYKMPLSQGEIIDNSKSTVYDSYDIDISKELDNEDISDLSDKISKLFTDNLQESNIRATSVLSKPYTGTNVENINIKRDSITMVSAGVTSPKVVKINANGSSEISELTGLAKTQNDSFVSNAGTTPDVTKTSWNMANVVARQLKDNRSSGSSQTGVVCSVNATFKTYFGNYPFYINVNTNVIFSDGKLSFIQ